MCYGRTICKCTIFQAECFFLLPFVGPGSMKTLDEYTNSWWKEKFHRALYPGQLKCKDCPFQSWSYPAARLLPKHTFFPSCFSPQQHSKGMLYAFREKYTPSLSMGALQEATESVCQISFWCHLKSAAMEMYHITAQPGPSIPLFCL